MFSPRLVLAQNGKTSRIPSICYQSTIYAEVESDDMGLRDILRQPKTYLRERSKARSEIENPTGVDPLALRPTGSTPDLGMDTSTSPPTSHDQESNGMRAVSSHTIHLTTVFFSHITDGPSNSDGRWSVFNRTENTDPGSSNPAVGPSAIDKKKSKLRSLVTSGAKFILYGVRESADAFGPLKSAAGGLCFILDNCEVRRSPRVCTP